MSEVNPSPQPYQPRDTSIGELAWCSILYGAVFGTMYATGAFNWLLSTFNSLSDAISNGLLTAVAILTASQLPIGVYVLQRNRWAALACYRTTMALIILSGISLPLCFLTDWRYIVLAIFPLGWGLYAQSLIRSSKEMQKLPE